MGAVSLRARLNLGNAGTKPYLLADPMSGAPVTGLYSQVPTAGVGVDVSVGQTALSILVVAIIGLAAFHLWTRPLQL